jgi:hypothetical protein
MNDLFKPDDTRDALRTVGGILFGLAFLMVLIRKGSGPGHWAKFPIFVDIAIPTVTLYGLGVLTRDRTGGLRVWQAVYAVFGVLLVPLLLREFVNLLGGSPGASLNTFWIFGVTAALAFYAGIVAGVRFQLLIGSIAVIISWSALWNDLLGGGITENWGVYRGLLGLAAIALLAGGLYMWRTNPGGDEGAASATHPGGDVSLWKASELLTGAGLAAVLGCAVGGLVTFLVVTLAQAFGPTVALRIQTPIETTNAWDIMLLLVSFGLVWLGSLIGTRGPVYVGAGGLALFLVIAGLDLNNTPPHQHDLGVWPWALLVIGIVGIAFSFIREASLGDQPRSLVQSLKGR